MFDSKLMAAVVIFLSLSVILSSLGHSGFLNGEFALR